MAAMLDEVEESIGALPALVQALEAKWRCVGRWKSWAGGGENEGGLFGVTCRASSRADRVEVDFCCALHEEARAACVQGGWSGKTICERRS